jgi:sugar lactone lactonase YvrE
MPPKLAGAVILICQVIAAGVASPAGSANAPLASLVVSGLKQPFGIAAHPDGTLFVAEYGRNRVLGIRADGARYTLIRLRRPTGLALVGSDRLVVASSESGTVHMVTLDGGASLLATGLHSPEDMAVSADGRIFVAETEAGSVVALTLGGAASRIAENLAAPAGVAFNGQNQLIVATREGELLQISPSAVLANSLRRELPVSGGLIATPQGELVLLEPGRGRVWVLECDNSMRLANDRFGHPVSGSVTPDGDLLISDWDKGAVVRIPALAFEKVADCAHEGETSE